MTVVSVDIHQDRILILDFGSQYTQLIARRVRELGVYCEILSSDLDEASFDAFSPNGVILSGGPESVTKANTPRAPEFIFAKGKPVLGICYGMQTMAEQLGGRVESVAKHEFGHADIAFEETPTIFSSFVNDEGAPLSSLDVWMSHGDQVVELPQGFVAVASTSTCPIAAMARPDQHFYGVQFHPEVHHTPRGAEILDAFLK
jgi:GMP synthase (glutamine-hydrolysing)